MSHPDTAQVVYVIECVRSTAVGSLRLKRSVPVIFALAFMNKVQHLIDAILGQIIEAADELRVVFRR